MTQLRVYSYDERGYDFDALVETECNECFIRICGFTSDDVADRSAYISSSTFHNNTSQLPWKTRLQFAWRWIRGKGIADYEIFTPVVLDNLIQALTDCREAIFVKAPVIAKDKV